MSAAQVTPTEKTQPKPKFTHRWRLRRVMPQLFGKLCRIVPTGKSKASKGVFAWNDPVTVEFADGTTVKASRMALSRAGSQRLSAGCQEAGCDQPHRARGLCVMHYDLKFR